MSSSTSSPEKVLTATFKEIDSIFADAGTDLPAVDFSKLMTALFVKRYTGSIRIDFRNGRPRVYSFDRPRRGLIVTA